MWWTSNFSTVPTLEHVSVLSLDIHKFSFQYLKILVIVLEIHGFVYYFFVVVAVAVVVGWFLILHLGVIGVLLIILALDFLDLLNSLYLSAHLLLQIVKLCCVIV